MRSLCRCQDWRQVQSVGFPVIDCIVGVQAVRSSDHVIDGLKAELRHELASFFCHHEQVIHNMFRLPNELLSKFRILGRNPNRAGVEVAFPHHDTAQRDQGGRRESHFLGSQQGRNYDVASGFQTAICLQDDPAAEIIQDQCLMGFGDAKFPR